MEDNPLISVMSPEILFKIVKCLSEKRPPSPVLLRDAL
jgi:hypothetical protein